MWTMSSSRGNARTRSSRRFGRSGVAAVSVGLAAALLIPSGPLGAQEAEPPPESPAPPLSEAERPQVRDSLWRPGPVVLDSVTVRPLDERLGRLAGPELREEATAPVVLVVHLAGPLDLTPRTSWPVVVLNGRPIENSRIAPSDPRILLGFLPDRERIREQNRVEVYWVGNERLTRTPEPVTFFGEEVPRPE